MAEFFAPTGGAKAAALRSLAAQCDGVDVESFVRTSMCFAGLTRTIYVS